MSLDFVQVDAFTSRPLYGNPAAVVFDADDLETATMQKIAREMNLSETVFILRPTRADADYRVRIFTPVSEMPFAGHPTVAAAYSVLTRLPHLANVSLLRQECGIGIIPVDVLHTPGGGTLLRMTQAQPSHKAASLTREAVAKMLGCREMDIAETPLEVISTGVPWLIVELKELATISQLVPDHGLIAQECKLMRACGITVFVERDDDGPVRIRVRTFAPGEGVSEDPVCGSGNGSVAAFIARHKHSDESSGSYIAEQGIEINRDGEVYASWERSGESLRVRIGGQAAFVIRGEICV